MEYRRRLYHHPDGDRIAQFKDHNLHVVHYSEPVDQELTLEELKDHLSLFPTYPTIFPTLPLLPSPVGFCISQRQFDSLKPGIYQAVVKSEIKPGRLVYGQAMIPGRTDREVLISTYLCHPQMANHELSGPLVQAYLYKMLKATGPHRHTFRFLICPENIEPQRFCTTMATSFVKMSKRVRRKLRRTRANGPRSGRDNTPAGAMSRPSTLRFGDTPLVSTFFRTVATNGNSVRPVSTFRSG